jgi:hypothetical protein
MLHYFIVAMIFSLTHIINPQANANSLSTTAPAPGSTSTSTLQEAKTGTAASVGGVVAASSAAIGATITAKNNNNKWSTVSYTLLDMIYSWLDTPVIDASLPHARSSYTTLFLWRTCERVCRSWKIASLRYGYGWHRLTLNVRTGSTPSSSSYGSHDIPYSTVVTGAVTPLRSLLEHLGASRLQRLQHITLKTSYCDAQLSQLRLLVPTLDHTVRSITMIPLALDISPNMVITVRPALIISKVTLKVIKWYNHCYHSNA